MTADQAQTLIRQLIESFPAVRYVALYQDGSLWSRQRAMVADVSAGESDRYEELLVNPSLLTLAKQRGDIDCGGLRFLLVAYGNFYQLVRQYRQGHISICIDLVADPIRLEGQIRTMIG
jgi:hypothetical protein